MSSNDLKVGEIGVGWDERRKRGLIVSHQTLPIVTTG